MNLKIDFMRKYTLLPALLLSVSLLTIKCKKDSGSTNYDGTWAGSTSQGKTFSFSVSGNQVNNVNITYNLTGSCSQTGATTTLFSSYAISGNSFSTTGSTTISGMFNSATSATGSFMITISGTPTGCTSTASGTWTATK